MSWLLILAAQAGELRLTDGVRWAEDVTLPADLADTRLHEGLVFGVAEPDGAEVGFVFVGRATQRVPVDPREARIVADRLAVAGQDAGALASQLDATWTEPVEVLIGLGEAAPWEAAIGALPEVVDLQRGVTWRGPDGMEHVVVTAFDPSGARAEARAALAARATALAEAGLDPLRALALDRADAAPVRWVLDGRGGRQWDPVLDGAGRWWTVAHDGGGAVDPRDATTVLWVSGAARRHLTGAPGPVADPRVTRATVNVVVTEEPNGVGHDVGIEAVVHVASRADTRVVVLSLPRRPSETVNGVVPVPGAFAVDAVTTEDGTPLERLGEPFGVVPTDRETSEVAAWRLPAVLPAGGTVKLRVRAYERWPASHRLDVKEWGVITLQRAGACVGPKDCSAIVQHWPEFLELGRVETGRPVVPTVPGRPADFPASVRVGTTRPGGWHASIGGEVVSRELGDGRWWTAETRGDAAVSFGQVEEAVASGSRGFPEIRFLTHSDVGRASPEFVRSVLHFYQGFLPDYPHARIDVVQAADAPFLGSIPGVKVCGPSGCREVSVALLRTEARDPIGLDIGSSPGSVVVHGLREVGDSGPGSRERGIETDRPYWVERGVVGALAGHWWTAPPYLPEDAWIGPAATDLYRDLFVATAWGDEVAARWREVEPPSAGTRALDGVRRRVGDGAFLRGMEAFLVGGEPTTAALERALEAASGAQLDGFFDVYLRGPAPSVDGVAEVGRDEVRLELASDVAFSAFEVPVVVELKGGARTTWVRIEGGRGSAVLPVAGRVERVSVDPEGWLPLRGHVARAESVARAGPE